MDKNLIQKIKQLEKIQPSSEWLDLTRHNLIARADFDQRKVTWLRHPQSIALVICLLLIFIGGPWLMVKASQPSLPGELLYSVKIISEDVQTRVASERSKVQLQTEFASRRLEELDKIADDSFKAKKVINNFKDNLTSISQSVSKISKEEAVAVAKKTQKIKEDLDKSREEAPLEIQEELAEAEKVVEQVNQQILAVLVEDQEDSFEESATTTPDEEVLIFLEEIDLETMTTTEEVIHNSDLPN